MKTSGIEERYAGKIEGVLECFDRVVVTGTLRGISHPEALAGVLRREGIRCFDLGVFADPLRQRICDQAREIAREAGVEIQYLARSKGVSGWQNFFKPGPFKNERPRLVGVQRDVSLIFVKKT